MAPLPPLYQLGTTLKLFVGVDWATEGHEVHAMDPGGEKIGARSFERSGDGLADLCKWLLDEADPGSVAIAIEVPHGSVVETLLERGFTVFSIDPKQLDRFRDRFPMAGTKDDRLGALVLADSLRTDTRLFRRISQLPTEHEAVDHGRNVLPGDHFVLTVGLTNLAFMLEQVGRDDDALALLREAHEKARDAGREAEARIQRDRLVVLPKKLGRADEAGALVRRPP